MERCVMRNYRLNKCKCVLFLLRFFGFGSEKLSEIINRVYPYWIGHVIFKTGLLYLTIKSMIDYIQNC